MAQAQVLLSPGDRLQLVVEAGEEFSGRYQVDVQGRIDLPYAGPILVAGLSATDAARVISARLVEAGLFKRHFVRSSVLVTAWAPLELRVSGAVYFPGAVRINAPAPRDRAGDKQEELPGAALPERKLSDALRAAGGVTLMADLAHVAVRRRGETRLYDLWGLMNGEGGDDPALQSGDEIIVPTGKVAQAALARPSAITPPGIKIFASNLTVPMQSSAGVGQISVAYGARLIQGATAANCVGGTDTTNAGRSVMMVRADRVTGKTITVETSLEDLMYRASDQTNPVLLEGDAVACFDSRVTRVRDVFRALADVLSPFGILKSLF